MQVENPNSGEGLKKAGIVSRAPHAHCSRTRQRKRKEQEHASIRSRFMHFHMILCIGVPREGLSVCV